jgi:hypothetical protein
MFVPVQKAFVLHERLEAYNFDAPFLAQGPNLQSGGQLIWWRERSDSVRTASTLASNGYEILIADLDALISIRLSNI